MTVTMETATLNGEGRQNVTCSMCVCVNDMKFIKVKFHPKTDHAGPERERERE